MALRSCFLAVLLASLLAPLAGRAGEARYFQQNGVTFSDARPSGQVSASPPAVAAGPAPSCQVVRRCWTPVTQYAWEGSWVGRWNPFVEPYLVYRPVALTHWELKTEVVSAPQGSNGVGAQAVVASTPPSTGFQTVAPQRFTPPAVPGPAASTPSRVSTVPAVPPTVAQTASPASSWGGIRRLDSDPPREGVPTAWRGVGTVR